MNSRTPKKSRPRPLSPHLQVYSWLITSTLSIFHRATGVMLSLGLLLVSCWLMMVAYHPETYNDFSEFLRSPYGLVLLAGWCFSLYYHLFNGIRHMFWDIGKGFDLKNVTRSGIAVLVLASISSVVTFLIGLEVIKL